MTGERHTNIDRGTLLAESMLGNGEVVRKLIAGGQDKEDILQQIVSDLGEDPVGQACFLKILFQNLGREGKLEVTNRRDAALAILTDVTNDGVRLTATIAPLVETNRAVVINAYMQAVRQQTEGNDPYAGSINALLEVGKAMVLIFRQARGRGRKKESIVSAWEELAQQFPDGEQSYIRAGMQEIEHGISPDKPRNPRASIPDNAEREKTTSIRLTSEQGAKLKTLMKMLKVRQEVLAGQIRVSQPWLSNLLTGRSPVRNLSGVKALVNNLRYAVAQRSTEGRFKDQDVTGINNFLNSILRWIDLGPAIAEPKGSIPINAVNYIHRQPEETAVQRVLDQDKGNYRFLLTVTGTPDSGKHSLVNFLADIAQSNRVQIVEIHCGIVARRNITPEAEEALVSNYVVESLASGWDLKVPAQGQIISFPDVARWYRLATLGTPPRAKRLFIFNGIEDLQHAEVQRKLLHVSEIMHNNDAYRSTGSAFVLVVTPKTLSLQRALEQTDAYHNGVRVGWFDLEQVGKLTAVLEIPNAEQLSQELFAQYGGQPALTHVAAMLLSDDPTLTPESVYQMALAGEGQFGRHVNRIKTLVSHSEEGFILYPKEGDYFLSGISVRWYVSQGMEIDLSAFNISQARINYLLCLGLFEVSEEGKKRLLKPRTKFYRDLFLTLYRGL